METTGHYGLSCLVRVPVRLRTRSCPFCLPISRPVPERWPEADREDATTGVDDVLADALKTAWDASDDLVDGFKSVEEILRSHGRNEAADVVARQITVYEIFQDVDVDEMSTGELADYVSFMTGRVQH